MQIIQRTSNSTRTAHSARAAGGPGAPHGAHTSRTSSSRRTSGPSGASDEAAEAPGEDVARAAGGGEDESGDSYALLAGAAAGFGAVGAALALADVASPLRAPFTLFFLIAAPAAGIAAVLRRLDALSRIVVAVVGAAALDLLVAEVMLALHAWSARAGVAAVAVLSAALLLLPLALGRTGGARRDG